MENDLFEVSRIRAVNFVVNLTNATFLLKDLRQRNELIEYSKNAWKIGDYAAASQVDAAVKIIDSVLVDSTLYTSSISCEA